MSKRQPETEKTRAAAAAYMSEGLFEGEEGEGAGDPSVAYGDNTTRSSPKTSSIDKLYIVLIRSRISRLSLRMRSKKKQNFKQDITKNARPPSSAAEFQPGSAHSKAIKFLSPNSELSQDVSVLKFGC